MHGIGTHKPFAAFQANPAAGSAFIDSDLGASGEASWQGARPRQLVSVPSVRAFKTLRLGVRPEHPKEGGLAFFQTLEFIPQLTLTGFKPLNQLQQQPGFNYPKIAGNSSRDAIMPMISRAIHLFQTDKSED